MTKKSKPPKCKPKNPKKKRADDTMDEDEQEPKEPTPTPSKEPVGVVQAFKESIIIRKLNPIKDTGVKKSKSTSKEKEKDKDKTSREKKSPSLPSSAEKTEREKHDSSATKVLQACKGLCKYLLDMKESSLSTYFDEHLAKYTPTNHTFSESDKNALKNRSKEHKVNDNGRVHIEVNGKKDAYINASHIKFDPSLQEYILTQYPLKDTIHDFWRMVSQKKVSRIIAVFEPTTDEAIEEFNKIPSSVSPMPTSPLDSVSGVAASASQTSHTRDQIIGTSIRCETNQIRCFFPLFTDHYMNLDNWLINTRKVETDERNKTWMSMYTVEIVAAECSEANYIRVFNCSTWPWKKVPSEEKKLLALVKAPYKDESALIAKSLKSEPIVVMCDLGLDRSATIVLTSVIIEMVLAGKTPDCDALFKKMRDQRANVFTMSMFYTYAIRAALVYLKMKLKTFNDTMAEDVKAMINEALNKVPFLAKK